LYGTKPSIFIIDEKNTDITHVLHKYVLDEVYELCGRVKKDLTNVNRRNLLYLMTPFVHTQYVLPSNFTLEMLTHELIRQVGQDMSNVIKVWNTTASNGKDGAMIIIEIQNE
jgi:chemotaxis methyl-accepting protein methylase